MSTQQATFQDRIARIQAGQGFTKTTVYVGMDTAFTYTPPSRGKPAGLGQTTGDVGYALRWPICIALGFAGHGLERYGTFQLVGMPDPQANLEIEMVTMALLGMAVTVVLTYFLGMRDRGLLVPKLLGVASGMLFFHNLVHLWPHLFASLFSTLWVSKVMAMTEPASMVWRGISFTF